LPNYLIVAGVLVAPVFTWVVWHDPALSTTGQRVFFTVLCLVGLFAALYVASHVYVWHE
jgi:hypothetical protein